MKRSAVTQLGSLPYCDVQQAVQYSLRHDIPFLPELPLLGDLMLEYITRPGRLSCLEEFKRHQFPVVKIQCVGPATLMMDNWSEDKAVESIYRHVSAIIDGLDAQEIILFLDEPDLGRPGFNYQNAWEAVFSSFPVSRRGIHCCGSMDWDTLFQSPLVDIISFNASQFPITGYDHYRSGKTIAWGIEKEKDIQDFQKGDLITPPCGLSPLKYKASDCGPVLQKLIHIKDKFT